jgi:hypothetical protein
MRDCRGHKIDLVHLKSVRVAMPLILDKAAFQNNLASLPLVTYQPGETVIVSGSKTGRLLILKKGNVAVVKEQRVCDAGSARTKARPKA